MGGMRDTVMPRLMAARLMRQNRRDGARGHGREFALMSAALSLWTLAWGARHFVVRFEAWLHDHLLLIGGLTCIGSAFVIARSRLVTHAEFSRSWLAAVPIRPAAARWEAARLEIFPALVVILAPLTYGFVVVASVAVFVAHGKPAALLPIWAFLWGAACVGAVGSFAIPSPRQHDLPPGSRYVPRRQLQQGRPLLPSLQSLGQWPVRLMFARAQPKLVARATVPVLLSMTMGSTADVVMVALGLLAATGALSLLVPSAISASVAVRRWLSPLPLPRRAVMRALLGHTLLVILGVSALDGFLAGVAGASYRACALAALWIASLGSAATIVGVIFLQWRETRRQ
jgi:hypothetical protein